MNTPMKNNSSPEPNHRGRRRPVDNPPKPTPRLPDPFAPRKPTGRIIYTPQEPHECQHDTAPLAVPEGTLWECFTCRSEWMSIRNFEQTAGEWLIIDRRHDDTHQPIGRTVVILLLILVAIGVGLTLILTSG